MTWQHTVNFTGKAPKGVGGGWPPRGIYQFVTVRTEYKSAEKNPDAKYIRCFHKVTAAYLAQEDGSFVHDESQNDRELRENTFFQHSSYSAQANEIRETELKALLIAHGNGTREAMTASAGERPLNAGMFDGKSGYLLYDPPPAGSPRTVYPEVRYMDQETFTKVQSGKLKPNWPQKGNAEKAARKGAQAAAMGGGMPGGAPGGPPVAPTAPTAPGVPVNGAGPATVAAAAVPAPPGGAVEQGW